MYVWVAVYHRRRYNATRGSLGCSSEACSHVCVSVPAGRRCVCPDSGARPKQLAGPVCDAPVEAEGPLPLACACENGGVCSPAPGGQLACACPPGTSGPACATAAAATSTRRAAVLVPVLLLVVLALGAAAAWFVVRKRPFGKGVTVGSLSSSASVSFRPGSNVEFGAEAAGGGYTLQETRKGRDFSNPMYDAVTAPTDAANTLPGIYEVPEEMKDKIVSAVISPSSSETRGTRGAGGAGAGGARALDPAGDSTADTAQLVLEDNS